MQIGLFSDVKIEWVIFLKKIAYWWISVNWFLVGVWRGLMIYNYVTTYGLGFVFSYRVVL